MMEKKLLLFFIIILLSNVSKAQEEPNSLTLLTYENNVIEYIIGTPSEVTGVVKPFIDDALSLISPKGKLIEIGSASGRDAEYIRSLGYSIECTDAVEGFINILKEKSFVAYRFNVITDQFISKYDLVFANGVFLHFTREQFSNVLTKIYASLNEEGILAFSIKLGEGEELVSTEKIEELRYYCYWNLKELTDLLTEKRFELISATENKKFLYLIARKKQ